MSDMAGIGVGGQALPRVYAAVTGNCQAMFVASALGTIPGFQAGCFGKEVRHNPVDGYSAETYATEALAEVIAARKAEGFHVLLVEQTWHRFDVIDPATIGGVDGVVRFPFVHHYGLWPQAAIVERAGLAAAAARMLRADRDALRANDAKSDVKMLDFFDAHYRTEVLYDTPLHPSPIMLAELVRQVASAPAFEGLGVDVAAVTERVARSRGLNTVFNHPIDASIAEALGCEWATRPTYMAYRACAAAMDSRDYPLAIRLIDAFLAEDAGDDPFFRRMIVPFAIQSLAAARTRTGDIDGGNALRRELIALDPQNIVWRVRYASVLLESGDAEGALAVAAGGLELSPRNTTLRQLSAQAALRLDDIAAAIEHMEIASSTLPDSEIRDRLVARTELSRCLQQIRRATDLTSRFPRAEAQFDTLRGKLTSHAEEVRELISAL